MTVSSRNRLGAIFCMVSGLIFIIVGLGQNWDYDRDTALLCTISGAIFFGAGLLVMIVILRGGNVSLNALIAMNDEVLLGRWASWKLSGTGQTSMEHAGKLLANRGINPKQWQSILLPSANIPAECNCVFGTLAPSHFGLQGVNAADIKGEGKLTIRDNVITVEGRRIVTIGSRVNGILLSILVGALSFAACGLILGAITGSGFGAVAGGSTYVIFRWWNLAKGEPVQFMAQIPERTVIYNKYQRSFCLELDNGAWASFRIQIYETKAPISALVMLGCLFGVRFKTFDTPPAPV